MRSCVRQPSRSRGRHVRQRVVVSSGRPLATARKAQPHPTKLELVVVAQHARRARRQSHAVDAQRMLAEAAELEVPRVW